MKPILLWELKQRKNYLFWWTVVTVGLITLLLSVYPSIHHQADQLNKVLNQLPATLRELKTGSSTVDVSSPIGYLNSQLFYLTLPLVQIIMAIGLGSALLAREEQNHTLELLLARPISRGNLLAAKALSGLVCMTIVGIAAMVTTLVLAPLVNLDVSAAALVAACAYSTLFSLSFGAIAFTLCAASNATRRLGVVLATVVSFGSYLFATLANLSHYLQTPAKFLPYHYYNPTRVLEGHSLPGLNLYIAVILILSFVISWRGFSKRDIN